MAALNLDSSELYINRELSWLEFNDRVMREGLNEDVPLLERLKFLAIVSSNLDEFFMIRVAGLRQQRAAGITHKDASGLTPAGQLAAIGERVARMVREQSHGVRQVLTELSAQGISVLSVAEAADEQRQFLRSIFSAEILPALTPLAVEELEPCPILPGLQLHVAMRLAAKQPDAQRPEKTVVVPVPKAFPRFISLPTERGLQLACLEEVIAAHAGTLYPDYTVQATAVFRLTRDADVVVEEDDPLELIQAMERAVRERGRRDIVRLEVEAAADPRLKKWLSDWCGTRPAEVLEIDGLLDAAALMDIASRPGFGRLKYRPWPPQPPRDLAEGQDIWQTLQERDVLLFHPYESFDPVVRFVEQAADDPNVLAIKQTLYRTSGDSPIIRALARAAESGKQVTVLVELKARFEEAKNVNWARRLEDAGCFVIYGVAGYKTHAKALLIVRRESHRICRYVHLSTGNYNDRTARMYSDIGLMTSDGDLCSDTAAFFNLVTGSSQSIGWKKFVIAPTGLRDRIIAMIDREIQTSTTESPGLIMVKLNSLQDKAICRELYRASRAGVRVLLNVRGICCLRPGVKGVSDNIKVVSIVDRYLEHARIIYFRNGGHEEVFLSSADWMVRNLDRRLELLLPVTQKEAKARLVGILNTFFADNVKARQLGPDGRYRPVAAKGPTIRAQERFYEEAVEAARPRTPTMEFRPLTKPAEE
ncbi:MAG: polyphosphate kinase 1 [Phycisphaerae bacterium]